jgi:coenzyme F420-reducing hydrogenase beta subunit
MEKKILFEKIGIGIEKCSGCGACYNSCMQNAIQMDYNEEGFLYPFVDANACVECGKCEKVCPVLNPVSTESGIQKVYAAASGRYREKSSSGAIFPIMAEHIIQEGGCIYAARYEEDFSVIIDKCCNLTNLTDFMGSKYVQASTGLIFRDIKKDLEQSKTVLFSGCPCQVAGLKGFLGKPYDNLYTIDLICHGTPSPKLFQKYISEIADNRKITGVNFRNKEFGWRCDTLEIQFDDGKYIKKEKTDLYFRGFLDAVINRSLCGQCPFAKIPRVGDITLGDCWDIEKYNNKINDTGGLSWVTVNSDQGMRLLEKIKQDLVIFEECDLKTLKFYNHSIYTPKKEHTDRQRFFELNRHMSAHRALELTINRKHDVGVVGLFSSPNYGCELSHLSLYHILKSLGYEPLMIERLGRDYHELDKNVARFIEENYPIYDIAKPIRNRGEQRKLNDLCDTFLVASDQIWKNILYEEQGNYYALDFVQDNKRKLCYGTSFGHDEYFGGSKVREEMKYYLHRFDAIGVREDTGVEICREIFDVEAVRVLDPVLTVDASLFTDLAQTSQRNIEGKYVFSYMLEPNLNKENVVKFVCEHFKLKDINATGMDITPARENGWNLKLERNVKVQDWVNFIKNSDFVVTDSFHGMCFAIIFEKPFLVIEHENRGNGRFYFLLKLLHLENRILKSPTKESEICQCYEAIDYVQVKAILESERKSSLTWLRNALEMEHDSDLTDNDMILRKMGELEEQLYLYSNSKVNRIEKKFDRISNATKELGFAGMCKVLLGKLKGKMRKSNGK